MIARKDSENMKCLIFFAAGRTSLLAWMFEIENRNSSLPRTHTRNRKNWHRPRLGVLDKTSNIRFNEKCVFRIIKIVSLLSTIPLSTCPTKAKKCECFVPSDFQITQNSLARSQKTTLTRSCVVKLQKNTSNSHSIVFMLPNSPIMYATELRNELISQPPASVATHVHPKPISNLVGKKKFELGKSLKVCYTKMMVDEESERAMSNCKWLGQQSLSHLRSSLRLLTPLDLLAKKRKANFQLSDLNDT